MRILNWRHRERGWVEWDPSAAAPASGRRTGRWLLEGRSSRWLARGRDDDADDADHPAGLAWGAADGAQMPGAPAMNVPIPRRGGQAPAAGGLQTEETLLPRARSWSGRRTTLLANSPSAGVALGPLVSPSFSGRGFIRQSPSVTSTSPAFSPPPFDLARNSLPTIISVGNLAAVASGAADISGRTRSGLVSASSSPRESESPPATPGVERDPLGGAQDPRNQQQQAVDQSLEAPLLTDKGDHPADSPTEPPPPASQPGA